MLGRTHHIIQRGNNRNVCFFRFARLCALSTAAILYYRVILGADSRICAYVELPALVSFEVLLTSSTENGGVSVDFCVTNVTGTDLPFNDAASTGMWP